jgi:MFS family permease
VTDPSNPSAAQTRIAAEYATVEQLVRAQLAKALGGVRGMIEGAVPTVAFTIIWLTTRELQLSLAISVGLAALMVVARIAQRQTVQFVLNSLVGIGIGALFAMKSGDAKDVFLPGIIYNSGYAVVLVVSILIGWPIIGFLLGAVTGDPTGWHADKPIVRLCTRLTWVLAAPCILRVPLWP